MESAHAYTPLLLLLWLFAVPVLTGLAMAPLLPSDRQKVRTVWFLGFLTDLALFEPVAVFCMMRIVYAGFDMLTRIYTVILIILSAAGLLRGVLILHRCRREGVRGREARFLHLFPGHRPVEVADLFHPRRGRVRIEQRIAKSELLYAVIFLVLLLIQLVMAVLYAPFDGDDAYYVVQSLQSQQTGTIQTLIPYIGYSTVLDYRHALAEYPVWIAYIARMSGIHATILSHTVLPLLWIPLCYAMYACCGRLIFKERTDLVALFLCFLCLFSMWGNVSIYTPETFFLMRTWQGKALIGNFVIPALFCLLMILFRQEEAEPGEIPVRERLFPWIMLFLLGVLSGFFSTSGILLVGMLLVSGAAVVILSRGKGTLMHKIRLLVLTGICCIPGGVLALMSLLLRGDM